MADSADPVSVLKAGAAILTPVLAPAGFTLHLTSHGHSSGGDFATGRFTKGTQYLELRLRHSLGMVTYGWDDTVISHAGYLRGLAVTGRYPGYSDDPPGASVTLPWTWQDRYLDSAMAIAVAMKPAWRRRGS